MNAHTLRTQLLGAFIGTSMLGVGAADAADAVLLDQALVNPYRILVKTLDADASVASVASQVQGALGAGTGIRYLSNVGIGVVELSKPADPKLLKAMIAKLEGTPGIAYAEPDYIVGIGTDQPSANLVPDDADYRRLWGMRKISAPVAWNTATDSNGIVVGVIDTGVDYNHEDLIANIWTNPGEVPNNGVDDDGNGYVDDIHGIDCFNDDSDPMDDHKHGTHVAGTIGAVGNNGIGVAGVTWGAQLMALKFLDETGNGPVSDAVECLDYAVDMKRRGVDVRITNNSWGGGGFSQAMEDAISASADEDMLFVAAAGNDGNDNDVNPGYPSSYDLPNVIAVASTDKTDALSPFSNYGATSVDLAAPGSSIYSTLIGNRYGVLSGTSMASPHVAGAVALLWGEQPDTSGLMIKSLVLDTVDVSTEITGRVLSNGRLNIASALGCTPGTPRMSSSLVNDFALEADQAHVVTASLSDCGALLGATGRLRLTNGDATVVLRDDGVAPDQVADDGILSASWTPENLGPASARVVLTLDGERYSQTVSGEILEFAGYYFNDQARYAWRDISAAGTPLNLGDDSYATVTPPFPLRFYGSSYEQIKVDSNGFIRFGGVSPGIINLPIPTGSETAFAAPFWDDLNPGADGNVYWAVRGAAPTRRFIIQYHEVPHFNSTNTASFQIVFYESSEDIRVTYKDVWFGEPSVNFGASATIGMQRDAAYGQQYSVGTPSIRNRTAILWTRGETEVPMPIPDLKVNGSDELQIVPVGEPVFVEYSLNANGYDGRADQTLLGFHGNREVVRFDYTRAVRNIPKRVAFNAPRRAGAWWFVYGIDPDADGEQGFAIYDAVPVWVQPENATADDMPNFPRKFRRWMERQP